MDDTLVEEVVACEGSADCIVEDVSLAGFLPHMPSSVVCAIVTVTSEG